MKKRYIYWIMFFTLQDLRCYYAQPDDGYYYSVEYEPLNDTPEDEGRYSGGRAGEVNKDAGGEHECHHAMDLALLFDSSYSITTDAWVKMKEAAKRLTDGLDISSDGAHVSILVYSTNVDDYYMFDENADKGKISKLIEGLKYYGEWPRLDRALSAIPHRVFSPFNGARSDVPKVVVVFTDGKLEGPSTKLGQSDLLNSLARSIENLRRKDVMLYGVATSGVTNNQVFDMIAGDQSRIMDINNMEQLINKLRNISIEICRGMY
ncbi:collagen alpha-1(XII) chain-like [Actinia tenebrosa]|uniref:Collagen alpha-1(XII) chain-like n=1 Tax=Actinia tenebrosa TaxID=6105 RepID=A0A6P8J343_ACTTE|nr:collagen alpha-1(XII) chain-like [Actinia tenebrosa]